MRTKRWYNAVCVNSGMIMISSFQFSIRFWRTLIALFFYYLYQLRELGHDY